MREKYNLVKLVRNGQTQPPKILIASASGMGNIGDDMLASITEAIFREVCDAEVRHAHVPYNWDDVAWADAVVLGGGGLLYDSSKNNVDQYLSFLEHAHYMGKPAFCLGLGTQGITTKYGKRRYKEILSLAELLIVRDEKDALHLHEDVGVHRPIQTTADLGFLFSKYLPDLFRHKHYELPATYHQLKAVKESSKLPLLGVSLVSELEFEENVTSNSPGNASKKNEAWGQLVSNKIVDLSKDFQIVLFVQSRDDMRYYEQLKKSIPDATIIELKEQDDALSALDFYRLFDGVITSRFHGMILSLLAQRPTVLFDGFNSDKIKKAVDSLLPELNSHWFDHKNIKNLKPDKSLISEFSLTDKQHDEINSAIVSAAKTIDYVRSACSKYGWA